MSRTYTAAAMNHNFQSPQPTQGAGLFVVAGFSAMSEAFSVMANALFVMANALFVMANALFAMANAPFAMGATMPSPIMTSRTGPEKVPLNGM